MPAGSRTCRTVASRYTTTGRVCSGAGIARCASCGGSLIVRSRSHGTGRVRRRAYFYACWSFHHRGSSVCKNSLEMPLAAADNAIVTALERHLLDESVLAAAMQRAAERAQRTALKKRVDQLSTELERLTGAIVAGGEAATLVQAVRERERLLTAAKADL